MSGKRIVVTMDSQFGKEAWQVNECDLDGLRGWFAARAKPLDPETLSYERPAPVEVKTETAETEVKQPEAQKLETSPPDQANKTEKKGGDEEEQPRLFGEE